MCSCGHSIDTHVKVHDNESCRELTCQKENGDERNCHRKQHDLCASNRPMGQIGTCNG